MRIKDLITHIFDYHVMAKRNWTLEHLVAWVQTVEPAEVSDHATTSRVLPGEMIAMRQAEERWREHQIARRQEENEWQSVSRAFTSKYGFGRKRGPDTV